jgi:hypothetical protein
MSNINALSTTDTQEQVNEALGLKADGAPLDAGAETKPAAGETPAPEGETKPAAGETKPADGEAAKADDAADDASEAGKALAAQRGRLEKRKGSIQTEIDTLIATRGSTRREIEAVAAELEAKRAELARLSGQIDAAKGGTPAPVAGQPAAGAPAAQPATAGGYTPAPFTEAEPELKNFDGYDQWARALAAYHGRKGAHEAAEIIRAERAREQAASRASVEQDAATRAREEAMRAHHARLAAYRDKHADFDTIAQAVSDLPCTPEMDAHITMSEQGPELIRHFALHPEDAERLAQLKGARLYVEFGKIESRLEDARKSGPSAEVPVTGAPKPIKPVGGAPTASQVPLGDDSQNYQDYKRMRDEQQYGKLRAS